MRDVRGGNYFARLLSEESIGVDCGVTLRCLELLCLTFPSVSQHWIGNS